jgi:acetate kinase
MKPAKPRILTVNGGSFALFEAGDSLRRILEGGIGRIGLPEATLRVKGLNQTDNFSRSVIAPDHTVAVGALIDCIEERSGCEALTAAGHRVVHGGPKYCKPPRQPGCRWAPAQAISIPDWFGTWRALNERDAIR